MFELDAPNLDGVNNYIYNRDVVIYTAFMKTKRKKISTILPENLLREAAAFTRANQTDTLVLALQELVRAYKRHSIFDLKGKLKIKFEAEIDRQRSRF